MPVEKDSEDRLKKIEKLLEDKTQKGSRLCWIRWNPNSKKGYEIDDALEDVHWMIYEISRLKKENRELKIFIDDYRRDLYLDLNPSSDD